MRKFLKANVGRAIVVQCVGFAARGQLVAVHGDGIKLVSVAILDESLPRNDWVQADGALYIPAGQVRFVQVA